MSPPCPAVSPHSLQCPFSVPPNFHSPRCPFSVPPLSPPLSPLPPRPRTFPGLSPGPDPASAPLSRSRGSLCGVPTQGCPRGTRSVAGTRTRVSPRGPPSPGTPREQSVRYRGNPRLRSQARGRAEPSQAWPYLHVRSTGRSGGSGPRALRGANPALNRENQGILWGFFTRSAGMERGGGLGGPRGLGGAGNGDAPGERGRSHPGLGFAGLGVLGKARGERKKQGY